MAIITDREIEDLVRESKQLRPSHLASTAFKPKGTHKERSFEVIGDGGNRFCVIIRVSSKNAMAFSVILGWVNPETGSLFKLRRYDGKSHQHTNKIERQKFYNSHVHYATERYQQIGLEEETFALIDTRFADQHEALRCMFGDCNFVYPSGSNHELFGDRS